MQRGCMKTGYAARNAARDAASSRCAEPGRVSAADGVARLVWQAWVTQRSAPIPSPALIKTICLCISEKLLAIVILSHSPQILRVNRQAPNALAGDGENC